MTAGPPITCVYLCTLGSHYKSTRASSPEGDRFHSLHSYHHPHSVAFTTHQLEYSSGSTIVERVIAYSQTRRSKGVISHESPEPGYIAVSFIVLVPNPASSTTSTHFGPVLLFSHPMASAVTYRRQIYNRKMQNTKTCIHEEQFILNALIKLLTLCSTSLSLTLNDSGSKWSELTSHV